MLFKARKGNRRIAPNRYSATAITLHWLLAALLAYQFTLGLRLEHAGAPEKFAAFQLHKSIGITILLLSLLRLAVRLTVPRPARADGGIKGAAASLTHALFYVVMIGGPLTGWAIVSASRLKVPTLLFGTIPWPHLPLGSSMIDKSETAHVVLVFLLPVLIGLHVAGVIYHLVRRDTVPSRMSGMAAGATVGLGLMLLTVAGLLGRMGPVPQLWNAAALSASAVPQPEGELAVPGSDASSRAIALAASAAPDAAASMAEEAEEGAASDWTVEPGGRIGFTTSYTGAAITGQFKRWSAKIRFGAEDLANSRIDATIDLRSVDTADDTRDTTLKGDDFFAVDRFATATLTARKFARSGPDRFTASGTLSLHGVKRPVTLSFTLKETGDKATARGTATVSRLAFGVGSGDWASTEAIPDTVKVDFVIPARRID